MIHVLSLDPAYLELIHHQQIHTATLKTVIFDQMMSKMLSESSNHDFFGSDETDPTIHLMQRLIARSLAPNATVEKSYMLTLASEIPTRIFSGHRLWNVLKDERSTIELMMPILIVSIERLLQEVELRQLTKNNNVCPNFNPINFLAQHLHHNNPRYLNVSEMSAYIGKLRNITKELCKQIYANDRKE